ncbi:MAG: DnaJ domain-containing protein [Anaerolineae bacterium]|nr:DnaJ domain-containing protein [Anaerolineae bacterium]
MASMTVSKPPRDPYAILGLDRTSDEAAIKRAYFRLVREHPPERDPEKFQELRAAYDQVRTAEARSQTDLFLLQPPPLLPRRRKPSYSLDVNPTDIITLALELGLAGLSIQEDFHEPELPKQ